MAIAIIIIGSTNILKIRAAVERWLYPDFSWCCKCGRPWKFVRGHSVWYNEHQGTFAVCETCWKNSDLHELKKYYTECYHDQLEQGMPDNHYVELMRAVEVDFNKTHESTSINGCPNCDP